jgi:hypothetical protein
VSQPPPPWMGRERWGGRSEGERGRVGRVGGFPNPILLRHWEWRCTNACLTTVGGHAHHCRATVCGDAPSAASPPWMAMQKGVSRVK